MDPSDGYGPEPANLRFLRRLVTVLTATMILGVIAVVATLVIRLQPPPVVALPDMLTLPDGEVAHAVTRTPTDWIVTTVGGRVFAFDADGVLTGEMALR